jgi:hypothetical protein
MGAGGGEKNTVTRNHLWLYYSWYTLLWLSLSISGGFVLNAIRMLV